MSVALDRLRPGLPVPPFHGLMAEAECWAAWATTDELKAYGAAIWRAMPQAIQSDFLAFTGRAAA